MRAKEIIAILEEFAPGGLQESWDNSGLMIGDSDSEVSSVLLGLDCTPELIQEAKERGAGMIITHHPLIFKGVKKIGNSTLLERMIVDIIKSDLVVYSIHTNIDKVPEGVSGIMADKLGLINRSVLEKSDDGENGLGIIGQLPRPMDATAFLDFVKKSFALDCLKHSKPLKSKISKVALCGGSGSSLIPSALKNGADLFISGDISYHNFFCEEHFMVVDIGHYESEIGVLDLLSSIILKKIPNFAVCKSERNNNPIYYH